MSNSTHLLTNNSTTNKTICVGTSSTNNNNSSWHLRSRSLESNKLQPPKTACCCLFVVWIVCRIALPLAPMGVRAGAQTTTTNRERGHWIYRGRRRRRNKLVRSTIYTIVWVSETTRLLLEPPAIPFACGVGGREKRGQRFLLDQKTKIITAWFVTKLGRGCRYNQGPINTRVVVQAYLFWICHTDDCGRLQEKKYFEKLFF